LQKFHFIYINHTLELEEATIFIAENAKSICDLAERSSDSNSFENIHKNGSHVTFFTTFLVVLFIIRLRKKSREVSARGKLPVGSHHILLLTSMC